LPTPASVASDEEESIEEYMAKLMQRLRGDAVPPTQVATTAAAIRPRPERADEEVSDGPLPPGDLGPLPTTGTAAQLAAAQAPLGEYKPSVAAPERPADLQMFRELANASARSAIAVHSTKVHRRSAVTKVIVSTLAAMTSLWLMLQAPDWRDIEFVFACVLLVVAGYWVGQTVDTLLQSIRASRYDGPEYEGEDGMQTGPLPIDIDRERW
jgi:hypothetical protein